MAKKWYSKSTAMNPRFFSVPNEINYKRRIFLSVSLEKCFIFKILFFTCNQVAFKNHVIQGVTMKKITILFLAFSLSFCTESGKQSNSEKQRSQVLAIALLSSGQCGEVNAPAIGGGTTRTQFDLLGTNCVSTTLGNIGFVQANLSDRNTNGVTGTTTASRMSPKRTFSTTGEKKVNVEITYMLNGADGFLDVIGNASLNESTAVATGPTFRIKPTTITYLIEATGGEGIFSKGTAPTSPPGTVKSLCLEIHEEGAGAHMFGWSKKCGELSTADRGNYEFDQEDVLFSAKGSHIGFVLNKASIQQIVVTTGAIGTAKSLSF
jgi:hypothetical protein